MGSSGCTFKSGVVVLSVVSVLAGGAAAQDLLSWPREVVDPAACGTSVVESWADGVARDRFRVTGRAPWALPAPQSVPGLPPGPMVPAVPAPGQRSAASPTLWLNFTGWTMTDALPPDTMGAIGPGRYVEVINSEFIVYSRRTGTQLSAVALNSFFPGSGTMCGDPRVLFDQQSQRWIVLATDFFQSRRIYLAVSKTDNPLGFWFKTSVATDQSFDAGKYPDFPTLGVDANGIYTAAFMIGSIRSMSIWAFEKAPLIDPSPSLGTVTVWRLMPFEGAIQPAHTYGGPAGEFLVSRFSSDALRIRRIDPPLTAPTLVDVGTIPVESQTQPPPAPALGSTTPLDAGDARPSWTVCRDGSLWTAQTVAYNGLAACRWYELDPVALTVVQYGTVSDPNMYYFYPSLMVNKRGDVVMGFSGSNANQYAAAYYTGRLATDPPGSMAPPLLLKAGEAPYTQLDERGRNRWGDYSVTSLDPVDELTFWTIQEYAAMPSGTVQRWGTWIARVNYLVVGDTNCDGVVNSADINPFVLALSGLAAYRAQYRDCSWLNADCNADGLVDFRDINPFVDLLAGP